MCIKTLVLGIKENFPDKKCNDTMVCSNFYQARKTGLPEKVSKVTGLT